MLIAASAAGAGADIEAALGGHAVVDRYVELHVSTRNGEPRRVTLQDGERLHMVEVGPDSPGPLPVVLRTPPAGGIRYKVGTSEGVLHEGVLELTLSSAPLIVIAGDPGPVHYDAAGFRVARTAAAGLPLTAQGYAEVAALVIDAALLHGLGSDRRAALESYLGLCGRLLVAGEPAGWTGELPGCAGRFITVAQPARLGERLQELLRGPSLRRVSSADLAALAPMSLPGWRWLLALLLVYLPCWLLLARRRRVFASLALPFFVSGVIALSFSRGANDIELVSWSEAQSGDEWAQTSRLVSVGGRRKFDQRLSLPVSAKLADWAPDAPAWQTGTDAATAALTVPTRMWSQHRLLIEQPTPLSAMVRLLAGVDGPRLVNAGAGELGGGWLYLDGETYRVPALAPGAEVAAAPGHDPDASLQRLMRRRSGEGAASVLLREAPGQWLLLRIGPGEPT